VQRAVDGDDVALGQHLLEIVDAATTNLLLLLGRERLVVEVQKLLAVEGRQAAQDALTDAADGDGADNLALEIELVLSSGCDVPLTGLDHLVCRHEVAHEDEDGHDDLLVYRYDVGARDLGDGDTTVGLVGRVEVDMVGSDASCDGELQIFGLCEALSCQVSGVEAVAIASETRLSLSASPLLAAAPGNIRSSDDDLGVD